MQIYHIVCNMIQISHFWNYIPNDLGNWPHLIKIGLDLPDRATQAKNKPFSYKTNYYRFVKHTVLMCMRKRQIFVTVILLSKWVVKQNNNHSHFQRRLEKEMFLTCIPYLSFIPILLSFIDNRVQVINIGHCSL